MKLLQNSDLDIDKSAAITIAAGMKAMAMADGDEHPAEIALVDRFLGEFQSEDLDMNLATLNSTEVQTYFLESLALVALADGAILDSERAFMDEVIVQMNYQDSSESIFKSVGKSMLAYFQGVELPESKAQAFQIGRELGLTDQEIADIIS